MIYREKIKHWSAVTSSNTAFVVRSAHPNARYRSHLTNTEKR